MLDIQELNQEWQETDKSGRNIPNWVIEKENGKNSADIVALSQEISKAHPMKAVLSNENLQYYQYNGINWERIKEKTARGHLEHEALTRLTAYNAYNVKRMQDVAKTVQVSAISKVNEFENQPTNLIAFKNGTLELETGEMRENRASDYIVNGHEIELVKDGQAPNIEAWGSYLFGNSWQLVKELLGYAFIPEYKTFNVIGLILDEEGGTGKSYFFDSIVHPLIGTKNISSKDIDTLTGSNGKSERFGLSGLHEMLLNLFMDLKDSRIDAPDMLRSLSGGDVIEVEAKNQNAFSVKLYALLLFTANQKPNMTINNALAQRVKIIPVVAPRARERPQEQANRALLWDEKTATKEIGAFAWIVIQAFLKAKERRQLTINQEVKQATQDWLHSQDIVAMFLDDVSQDTDLQIEGGASKSQTWALFGLWCKENQIHSKYTKKQFNNAMKRLGYQEVRTRVHSCADNNSSFGTNNPISSWKGLSLKKYFNDFED